MIQGHVPSQIIHTFRAFLEFCYIARKNIITETDLSALEGALSSFYANREIFITSGVREEFLLPRQHSLTHYPQLIRHYGAPNRISSSITESQHIRVVKEPWQRSNRHEALSQMLVTNQRLDKLAAARSDFAKHGMLEGSVLPDSDLGCESLISPCRHLLVMTLSAVMTPGPVNQVATEAIEDDHGQQRMIPDEDLDDEAINERNTTAGVMLPSTIRRSYLLSIFLFNDINRDFLLRREMDS